MLFIPLRVKHFLRSLSIHKLITVYEWLTLCQTNTYHSDPLLAYNKLAQGLNKSVTEFSSTVTSYLDSCLAANLCTQFMDDIGGRMETFDKVIPILRPMFDCLRKIGQ